MSSLDQFLVFKEAADSGNITLASKRLHISQPSVSVHIRNLEREYKTELFRRTNRGVELTQAGCILYEKVDLILRTLESAREEIQDCCSNQNKLVHVGATLTIGEYLLPSLIGLATANCECVRIKAHIANTATISKEVLDKQVPIGLIEGPVDSTDEIAISEFWHDELVLVVAYDHPWAKRIQVDFDELTTESYITREKGSGTRAVAERSLMRCGFDPSQLNIAMELSSTTAIKETVASGTGFTILSALTVQKECRNKRLSMLRVCNCNLTRPLSIITRKAAMLTPAEQQFLELISKPALLQTVLPAPFLPSLPPGNSSGRTSKLETDYERKAPACERTRVPVEEAIAEWSELPDIERQICAAIYENETMNSAELGQLFGMTQRNVLPHLNELIDKSIVEAFGGSRKRRYKITTSHT